MEQGERIVCGFLGAVVKGSVKLHSQESPPSMSKKCDLSAADFAFTFQGNIQPDAVS